MQREAHPAPEKIERFARGEGSPEENRLVVGHLLRGCPGCQKLAARTAARDRSGIAQQESALAHLLRSGFA